MSDITAAAYLKQATASAHRETEAAANSRMIMEGRIGPVEYRQWIQANYGVWAAIEKTMSHLLDNALQRPRWAPYLLGFSTQLRADLVACSIMPFPQVETVQKLNWTDEATALGVLYVLNGSTLGGKYLYPALKRNEHLHELEDFYFYRACSELRPEHWSGFKHFLNEQLSDRAEQQRAEAAASWVFSEFTQAYRVGIK